MLGGGRVSFRTGPLHLLIDSTGLKLFGQGEWQEAKHGRARRSWRKLHLALDAETGEIAASTLTGNDADDAGQMPDLLGQIEGEIASVTADGAYDGEPVYQAVESRQPGRPPMCDGGRLGFAAPERPTQGWRRRGEAEAAIAGLR